MRKISDTAKIQAFLTAVRAQRKKMRLPQKVLAHELGLGVSAYSKIESGATGLNVGIFNFLCNRLNLRPENYFFPN